VLLLRRREWTHDQAIKYNGRLSILCVLIIDTEEKIAFGLGDAKKFERAIKARKPKWNKYLAKQKITDDAEDKMLKKAAEYYALLKKSGLKPGDTVPSDDPNGRKINQLAAEHKRLLDEFEKVRKESERAKYEVGIISEAIEQRIRDGVAFTHRQPPKLEVHRGCAGNQPSFVYKMFLDEEEFQTFLDQGALRKLAPTR
jgi:hypothetical protein